MVSVMVRIAKATRRAERGRPIFESAMPGMMIRKIKLKEEVRSDKKSA